MILKDEIINWILVIRLSYNNTMKDKKKLEILLKVIKRVYDKNPGM